MTTSDFADLRQRVQLGAQALTKPPVGSHGSTSDLSADESILMHTAGYEAVDLVYGISVVSVPYGVWNWGTGEIRSASGAHNLAVDSASKALEAECAKVGGHGVVGVDVSVEVYPSHVDVELTGTAVRPIGAGPITGRPFVSDFSARDFALLQSAGWIPVGLAFGASFVYAPRRTAGVAMRQASQNVELTNLTEAMYSAREAAMERLQSSALAAGGTGVVKVEMHEGPMRFASHAIGFTAWGTAVRLQHEAHRYVSPDVVLSMDDAVVMFDAASLRK
jgi:uncharacterized protein YbjQ (UPF0145 family)